MDKKIYEISQYGKRNYERYVGMMQKLLKKIKKSFFN